MGRARIVDYVLTTFEDRLMELGLYLVMQASQHEKRFVLVDRTDSKEEESVDYDTDTYITDDEELGHGIDTGRSSHFLDIEPEPKVITTTTSMPSPIVEPARDLTTFYFLEEAGLRAEAKPKPKVE
ncbi:uncharacterized protein A4U43_C05F7000 [Asparagus officinalis]|uniref:Uncharacterized protein n=1 Tax=Asparagus officinalis TaxID=4686 RepID=A0A5P1EU80_ASPOF|nr:uncharacterized protein A4U43_C05F7000 [Asparagus officinalis]